MKEQTPWIPSLSLKAGSLQTESEMEVRCLLDDLGIRDKQQSPISQTKRYIVRNGIPVLLPTNLIDLFKSNILSAQSKFRIMLEPVLWKKRDSSKLSDAQNVESVGGFFERHFGKEVVDYLVDPFVAGTSAGDPDSLCMRYSFPELWNLEQRFGSIIAGAVRSKFTGRREKSQETKSSLDKKKHQRGSFSFFGGMQTIADRLCKELDRDELKLNSKVLSLSYSHDGKSALENWSVSCSLNSDKHSQGSNFDAVIMAAPLCNVEEMKISKGGQIFPLDFLPQVSYMPLSVIITAFKKANVKRPLEGFGVLVPSKEQQNGLKSLGTLFSSMMFPDRAPSDIHLYTTFIGGSRNKELAKTSTEELKEIVTSDLRQLLGVEGEPLYVNHFYWSKAFPLYGLNYGSVLEAIEKMEENLPGFFYAGNHRGGLSVGKAITSGCSAADLVISYLESSSDDKMKMFKDESSL
ncbi:protoporphyrinogen oxidase 2, chloroplastic/mitochondrial isoform X3 [Tripterygium wilfordii]|uniref:protoporphyrinogen oxidase 2, chloroplastic/mitochondrial isoform X3 n=1 Tax=Tripterygium wilfordii TaxID=458696 RepID=UPI0018F816C8|nr:protoporphyrinogen oxidase 2, chloroplastic/mitochondrial isoform X3 [Tripterygium wilfordii]XP_038716033.1 protoporphyrinogen oxidase 2, chloroplastic/mitochondrial isoform X3 [Tripterygium wilfordii]XP_038716034.1 protoporphyrinogen oxidase 2, chloroplastic/mitochondrial isoform X3 [Tripterygium wilfordii]